MACYSQEHYVQQKADEFARNTIELILSKSAYRQFCVDIFIGIMRVRCGLVSLLR